MAGIESRGSVGESRPGNIAATMASPTYDDAFVDELLKDVDAYLHRLTVLTDFAESQVEERIRLARLVNRLAVGSRRAPTGDQRTAADHRVARRPPPLGGGIHRDEGRACTSKDPASGSAHPFPMKQTPIFIVVRDLLSPLQELVGWLERAGQERIVLVDNDSTYPPMVDYLSTTPHTVVRCGWNMGHRSPWLSGAIFEMADEQSYVVTDPDIVPDEDCPLDAIDHFAEILDAHPEVHRVGFGLRIDDLPDHYDPRPM